jgi:geranylgeranyl diphosphate synthase type II
LELSTYISAKRKLIEDYLEHLLKNNTEIPVISEAMRYSVFAGGKRLRPVLALMACELFEGNTEDVLPFACSIEMIHTYSLIHDDLPAMDNDDFRRGKPTSHKVYGDGFAVLAGDALLNYAFEVIIGEIKKNPKIEFIKAAEVICRASGTQGMIGGQCIDLFYENRSIDIETLKSMHERKTGALIAASLSAGAIIVGACEENIRNIYEFGKLIGLAFQIADDILDIEGNVDRLGKQTGKDMSKHKSNFISFYGVDKSKKIASEIIENAKKMLDIYGKKGYYLRELANYIISRDN